MLVVSSLLRRLRCNLMELAERSDSRWHALSRLTPAQHTLIKQPAWALHLANHRSKLSTNLELEE